MTMTTQTTTERDRLIDTLATVKQQRDETTASITEELAVADKAAAEIRRILSRPDVLRRRLLDNNEKAELLIRKLETAVSQEMPRVLTEALQRVETELEHLRMSDDYSRAVPRTKRLMAARADLRALILVPGDVTDAVRQLTLQLEGLDND